MSHLAVCLKCGVYLAKDSLVCTQCGHCVGAAALEGDSSPEATPPQPPPAESPETATIAATGKRGGALMIAIPSLQRLNGKGVEVKTHGGVVRTIFRATYRK